MNKIKIIADDKIPFLKGVLEPFAEVEYYSGKEITKEKVQDADALIIRTRTKCDESLLAGTSVKLITTATIGVDHIDAEYCEQNNIEWVNAPGCNSTSVMQYISSTLLSLAQKEEFNLSEKTIGIVGVGNVGSKVKKAAEIIGLNVLLNDPPRASIEGEKDFCSLDKIIEESDIITFHVPLIKIGDYKTFHLANKDLFNQVKKKPIIINSSRGEVVETAAIKEAIKNNQVSNVVIDVWENEPNVDLELLGIVDFGTPHIAGYSADGKVNGTSVCVNKVNAFFSLGLKPNWYPKNIPLAENGNEIVIDCRDKTDQKIISEAVRATYSISKDSEILKSSPQTFEKQRGDYRIRREFANYNVQLNNYNLNVVEKLSELGFKIK